MIVIIPTLDQPKMLILKPLESKLLPHITWKKLQTISSYSYLHKEEDYKESTIDGSFYALNFPEHRATLGFIWNPNDLLEIRIDNEWRDQQANPLREGPSQSVNSHIGSELLPCPAR
jgi:outer membrane receptor for ferrienterochelin and colicin